MPSAEAAERRGDHLDLAAIFGFGDHDAGDQRAEDRRQADRRGRQAGEDHDQQADREEQLGALGPRRLGEQRRQQQRPSEQHRDRDRPPPISERAEQRADAGSPACGAIAPSRNTIGTSARSSNSSMASAARPTGLCVPTAAARARSTTRPARGRGRSTPVGALHRCRYSPPPIRIARAEQLGGADAEHQPAHAPQPAERQLEPDREQQQDDAELGERLDRVRVGDRHVVEPGMSPVERAEPGRPDDHADQDEADDRRDPKPREGRDDDPGGAEDHQRVAEARGREVARPCVVLVPFSHRGTAVEADVMTSEHDRRARLDHRRRRARRG